MNIREYIESGILEAYATGMLIKADAQKVEEMAAQHPEVQKALTDAQETMGNFAKAYSTTPKPEWKEDILKAAFEEREEKATSSAKEETPVISLEEKTKKITPSYGLVAASVALLISIGINVFQYNNLQSFRNQWEQTNLRLAELEQSHQVMVTHYNNKAHELDVLMDPQTANFVMKAVEGREDNYRADVYWNAQSEMVYLDVKSLPNAPQGMQYQLWALVDGKPVDMGVFNAIADNQAKKLREMGTIPGAQAFAVTLEPMGGSVKPTMEEMYVYGALSAV